jgi:hypothetical protein
MVEPSSDVDRDPVRNRQLGGLDRPTAAEDQGVSQLRREGELQPDHLLVREGVVLHLLQVLGRVDSPELVPRGRAGSDQLVARQHTFGLQVFDDQPVLDGGEDVHPDGELVVGRPDNGLPAFGHESLPPVKEPAGFTERSTAPPGPT